MKAKNPLRRRASKTKFPLRQDIRELYDHVERLLPVIEKSNDLLRTTQMRAIHMTLGWVLGESAPPIEIVEED